jgi:hypothetical protein
MMIVSFSVSFVFRGSEPGCSAVCALGDVEAVVCRLRTRSVWSNAKELPGVDASGGKRHSEGALMAALSLDLLVKRSPITS